LTFDPSTFFLSVDYTGPLGSNEVLITGLLANGQFYEAYFNLTGLVVPPPTFASALVDRIVSLNGVDEYFLPAIVTVPGTTATFSIESTLLDGITLTPAYALTYANVPLLMIDLRPVDFLDVGVITIKINVSNGFASTIYPLQITVNNLQPEFEKNTLALLPNISITIPINLDNQWFPV